MRVAWTTTFLKKLENYYYNKQFYTIIFLLFFKLFNCVCSTRESGKVVQFIEKIDSFFVDNGEIMREKNHS